MDDTTNAYAQDFNRGDNEGSAFVLGPNEALGDLKEHVKGVLADIAKQRIQNQKALNAVGSNSFKGASEWDIKNELMPSRTSLLAKQAEVSKNMHNDPHYLDSDAGRQAVYELRKAQSDHSALTDAAVNLNTEYKANVAKVETGDYDPQGVVNMGQRNKMKIWDRAASEPVILQKAFHYEKYLEDGKKMIPDNTITTTSTDGQVKTSTENKMFVNGKPTSYFTSIVQPLVETQIKTSEGQKAINDKMKQEDIPNNPEGVAKATDLVRNDLYRLKNQKFDQEIKPEPAADNKKKWSVNGNALQNDKNIWHYDRNDQGEVYTMSHTDASENKELNFKVFDKDGHVEEIKAVPTRIEYPKGATQPVIYANQAVKVDDPDNEGKKITQLVERQVPYEFNAAKIENEYGKNPYEVRLAVTGSLEQGGGIKTGKVGGSSKQAYKEPVVDSQDQFDALPKGAYYRDSQGTLHKKKK